MKRPGWIARLKRRYRRALFAGVDFILDHEIAALRALSDALQEEQRRQLLAQLDRYDRIDRSPNMRRQRLIDDDSDFLRRNWPSDIVFPGADLTHCADIELHRRGGVALTIKAQAFLVHGRFDGFDFRFSRTGLMNPQAHAIDASLVRLLDADTDWDTGLVRLFVPFSAEKSSYRVVPP